MEEINHFFPRISLLAQPFLLKANYHPIRIRSDCFRNLSFVREEFYFTNIIVDSQWSLWNKL